MKIKILRPALYFPQKFGFSHSRNPFAVLPFARKTRSLHKILYSLTKNAGCPSTDPAKSSKLHVLPSKNEIKKANSLEELIKINKSLEKSFLELVSKTESFGEIIEILSRKKFKTDILVQKSSQSEFIDILETLAIRNSENEGKLASLILEKGFLSILNRGFEFKKKIRTLNSPSEFEAFVSAKFMDKCDRLQLYGRIFRKKIAPICGYLSKARIFKDDFSSLDLLQILKFYRLFLSPVSNLNLSSEILRIINSLTLENLKKLKSKHFYRMIILVEGLERDINKKQEFYYNLRLIRPNEEASILKIGDVAKITKAVRGRTEFVDEEIGLIVKAVLKRKGEKWSLKKIRKIARVLNNEYYVFQYYSDFAQKLRELFLFSYRDSKETALKKDFRRLSAFNSMKIRFPREFLEKMLQKYPESIKDYILVKTGSRVAILLSDSERFKVLLINQISDSITRLKTFETDLNLSFEIQKSQLGLLMTGLMFYKSAFLDQQQTLSKTLIDLSLLARSFPRTLKKTLNFFLFNAIPLLTTSSLNPSLLAHCEKLQKSFYYSEPVSGNKTLLSKPEKALKKLIQKIEPGLNVKADYRIGVYSVDFYIESKKMIIEYHGLQHFFLENIPLKEFLPKDLVKRDVLKAKGYKYIVITCWVWKKLRTERDQEHFIRDLMSSERNFRYNTGVQRRTKNLSNL